MRDFEKREILAKEASSLIKEFRDESQIFGEKSFKNIKIRDDFNMIIIEDICDGIIEVNLNEVSKVFKEEIEEIGPYGVHFYNALYELREETTSRFEEMDKDLFMEQIGKTYYVQHKCEEIYDRLKEIEKEFCNLK
ncbi:hypothetical protein FHH43_09590 [Clostridium perfringens]|nr:hypothetical protein [Clostridium perfringens]